MLAQRTWPDQFSEQGGDFPERFQSVGRPTEFARQIDVPPNRISQILSGRRSITGDTALRLGHWFGTDPQFWLNLQSQYDLAVADRQVGETIRHLPTRSSLSVRTEQTRLA